MKKLLLQSFAQSIPQWFLGHIWALILVSCFVGFLLGGFVIAARFSTIKRYIRLVETSTIDVLESKFLGVRIVCRRMLVNSSKAKNYIQNLTPPPLKSTGTLNASQVVLTEPDEYFYYIPENIDPDTPRGIGFPRKVKLVWGKPPIPELTQSLPVGFISVKNDGIWIPTRVGPNNVGLSMKEFLSRKFRKIMRNFYILDYIEAGDCIGYIQPITKRTKPIPVIAEISGYILQFGAYERTALVAGASVMLIAKLEVQHILSNHVGTFHDSENGKPFAELGKIIKAGTVIGVIKHLGGLRHEITAPCDLVLLRSFAHSPNTEKGVPVEYNGKLYSYRALEKSPS